MMWKNVLLLFAGLVLSFAVIHKISGSKSPLKRAFFSIASGMLAMLAIDLAAGFTGVLIPISPLSAIIAAVGGVPGVSLMLLLNLIV